jgi:hypothetical protein
MARYQEARKFLKERLQLFRELRLTVYEERAQSALRECQPCQA